MKRIFLPLAAAMVAHLSAAETPAVFAGLFEKDVPIRAQIGVVMPPQDIDKYVAKVEEAARKNPEWFREASSKAKAGAPLPYDEKLGLTKEDYDQYLALWAKREFKPTEEVALVLRQSGADQWSISATGNAGTISTLRYNPKDDIFRSPNGDLKRIEDISADPSSILGAWTGHEWRFEEENTLAKIKENIAVGQFADKKFGLLVYRVQEISSEGTRLLDKSLVIRFPLGKGSAAPPAAPTKLEPTKPAPTKPAPAKPVPAKKK
ncbi:MAG: hypothetical protein CFE26_05260 [Verrucomicrobiales bacterium VVV1]|nr:MAG: hypothetical protein CFE26_05260 [Verrucomicrobiales bacterium VVV1]